MFNSLTGLLKALFSIIFKKQKDDYNHLRPHQGINEIPDEKITTYTGKIKKDQVLRGLHHHYYRSCA